MVKHKEANVAKSVMTIRYHGFLRKGRRRPGTRKIRRPQDMMPMTFIANMKVKTA